MDRPVNAPTNIPHWAWELRAWHNRGEKGPRPADAPKSLWKYPWYWPWYGWRNWVDRHKKPTPPTPQHVVMYDSTDLSEVPANASAVAGYTAGHWPTFSQIASRFPKALRLSIAIGSKYDAEALDIEPGDSIPALAPDWVKRQHQRGIKRPVVYAAVSEMPKVLAALKAAGIQRSQFRVWTAHYIGRQHQCSPSTCGSNKFGFNDIADATQYWDHALGRNLDVSICSPSFFSDSL